MKLTDWNIAGLSFVTFMILAAIVAILVAARIEKGSNNDNQH